jgi:hypothetical protein
MIRNVDSLPPAIHSATARRRPGPPQSAAFHKVFQERTKTPEQAQPPVSTKPSEPAKTPGTANTPATAKAPEAAKPALTSVTSLSNGGLMADPTGYDYYGGLIHYNPNYYATREAASMLAQQLGGSVVDSTGGISNNQVQYSIALPNGTTVNAGNLLAVMNNAVYRQSSGLMDEKIAELLNNNAPGTPGAGVGLYTVRNGQVSFDPSQNPAVIQYT